MLLFRPALIAVFAVLCTMMTFAPGEALAHAGHHVSQQPIATKQTQQAHAFQAPQDMRHCAGQSCCGPACSSGAYAMASADAIVAPDLNAAAVVPIQSIAAHGTKPGGVRRPPRG